MPKPLLITFKGATLNVREWSERTGIDHRTIAYRINSGWPVENALTTKAYGPRPAKPSLADALPAIAQHHAEMQRIRTDMRRAMRVLMHNTEKQAAEIGRTYALGVGLLIDQANRGAEEAARGVGQNFRKNAGDRIPSSAQERA